MSEEATGVDLVRLQLADIEVRVTICTGAGNVGCLLACWYATDKTEATRTRKLAVLVARKRVVGKLRAGDSVLATGQYCAAGAAQSVLIQLDAFGYRSGCLLGSRAQCLLKLTDLMINMNCWRRRNWCMLLFSWGSSPPGSAALREWPVPGRESDEPSAFPPISASSGFIGAAG